MSIEHYRKEREEKRQAAIKDLTDAMNAIEQKEREPDNFGQLGIKLSCPGHRLALSWPLRRREQ